MKEEKFITVTKNNKFHIEIRNLICPAGYYYMNNCSDYTSLVRFMGLYSPEFVLIDLNTMSKDILNTIETLEDGMFCPVILISNYNNSEVELLIENYNILYVLNNTQEKNVLINTIELAILNFNRIKILNDKLKNLSDNYETRKLVERAKWILMEQKKITEGEAYERMRKKSMNTRIPMREIAEAILFTYNMENEKL